MVESAGMTIPMLCCSPDFSLPDPEARRREIEREKNWIRMAAELGARYCRVLSGQRRPELTATKGLERRGAEHRGVPAGGGAVRRDAHPRESLQGRFLELPEFAQKMDVFCELVDRMHHPRFGVNYDPSNAFLAGDDPLELLRRVKHRVVTMHASDRSLIEGTLEDLRREEGGAKGYARGSVTARSAAASTTTTRFSANSAASVSTAGSALRTAWTAWISSSRVRGSSAPRSRSIGRSEAV
jgi:sugar phosphate isomerase/epimerase